MLITNVINITIYYSRREQYNTNTTIKLMLIINAVVLILYTVLLI